MIDKLDISKYRVSQDKPRPVEPFYIAASHISEIEIDTEIKTEEDIDDPLSSIEIEQVADDIPERV